MGFLLDGIINDVFVLDGDSTSANEKVSRPTVARVHPKAAGGPLVPFCAEDRASSGPGVLDFFSENGLIFG